LHLLAALALGIGELWNVVDINVSGILAAAFSGNASVISTRALSWLVASAYLGAFLGAPIFGWSADRYGRKVTLVATLVLLTVSTGSAALSAGVGWLILFRALSGLTIGAYVVVSVPYLAEIMPVRERGRMLLIVAGIGSVAAPMTLLGAHVLTDTGAGENAWRWICAACGIGSALTAALVLRLPESPRWLRSRQRADFADRAEGAFLSAAPFLRRPVIGASTSGVHASKAPPVEISSPDVRSVRLGLLLTFAVLLNVLSPWTTVGFPILSGAVLVDRGFSVTDSLLLSGLGGFGIVIGLFGASWKIDAL